MPLGDSDQVGQVWHWLLEVSSVTPDASANTGHAAIQGPAAVPPLHCRDTLQTASPVTYSTLPQRIQFPVNTLYGETLWLTAWVHKLVFLPLMKIPVISHVVMGQAS